MQVQTVEHQVDEHHHGGAEQQRLRVGGAEPDPRLMRGWGRSPQRSAIVSALAELDESYHNGELDEADYLQQRAELVALALRQTQGEPASADEDSDSEAESQNDNEEAGGRDA